MMAIERPSVVGFFPVTGVVGVVGYVPPTPKPLAWLLGALEGKCHKNGVINARKNARLGADNARSGAHPSDVMGISTLENARYRAPNARVLIRHPLGVR